MGCEAGHQCPATANANICNKTTTKHQHVVNQTTINSSVQTIPTKKELNLQQINKYSSSNKTIIKEYIKLMLKQFHPTQILQDAACFKDCWMMSKLLQHATCCQACRPTAYHCHLPRPSCRRGHGRQRHRASRTVAPRGPRDTGVAGGAGDGRPPDTKRERQGRF